MNLNLKLKNILLLLTHVLVFYDYYYILYTGVFIKTYFFWNVYIFVINF